jgi:T5SS/PEP-CTERM-associated repeat protein
MKRSTKVTSGWVLLIALSTAMAVLSGRPAFAENYTWSGDGIDAYWSTPENWEPTGVPDTTDDTAIFDSGSPDPILVKFNKSNTAGTLRIRNANVVFDLGGYTNSFLVPYQYIAADAASLTGSLKIVNGMVYAPRNPESTGTNPYFYVGRNANSYGKIIVSGQGAVLDTKDNRFHLGDSTTGTGELVVEDGAYAYFRSPGVCYVGQSGHGKVTISNAYWYTPTFKAALNTGNTAEILVTGPDSRWVRTTGGSIYRTIGSKGSADIVIEKGAKVHSSLETLVLGVNAGATGTVTIRDPGSIIGGTRAESAYLLAVTLGGTGHYEVAKSPESFGIGGVGTLNILDGGRMEDSADTKATYFYVGPGSRVKIRDAELSWCKDSAGARNSPFFFREGSYFTVELTEETEVFSQNTPLIWSGADLAGPSRTNILENAVLEVELKEGFVPAFNSVFQIFRYEGELTGTFAGLEDGGEFKVGDSLFRIDYGNRTDSVITLTALPPHGSMVLIR